MANRSVRVLPKHIHSLCRFNSAAVPLLRLTGMPEPARRGETAPAPADINLHDTEALFRPVSTGCLIRSAATLQMASFGPMVDIGTWVMSSRLMENELIRKAVMGFTEMTFYEHFCGGADLKAAGETANKLWGGRGLSAMLDYGLEHATDNESCDSNTHVIVQTIDSSKELQDSAVSFVVVKITAICPVKLLKRVSDLLRWEYRGNTLHLPWKLNSFPVFSPTSPLYHTLSAPPPLTPEEEQDLQLAYQRINRICTRAVSENTPLLIDAEDTSVQPAIDYIAYSAAIEHSGGARDPIIFNTIQAYLKDARERLVIAKGAADGMGVPVGFKLVRGAYMSAERRVAGELGVESPVHDTIQDTHDCYNGCAEFLLEEIAGGSGSVVLATHNVQSGKLAASKAVDLGIRKSNPNIQFAQLYGMSEALSLGLKNAGFKVSKYLPFGPVEHIMPYLLRRAEENRGLLSSSAIDRQLMRKEIMRRLVSRS